MSSHPVGQPIWADSNDLRTSFALAMSAMYRAEVPLYSTLVDIVTDINGSVQADTMDSRVFSMRFGDSHEPRIDIERHGAIRVGTAQELSVISKIFNLMGLSPVGYYDLSEAGLPMHATCFRPTSTEALRRNPFRVFTSLLRPKLIKNFEARQLAKDVLKRRNIFSTSLLSLLEIAEKQNGRFTIGQSEQFVGEALKVFQWQGTAITTPEEYHLLKAEHPVIADIVCFGTSHINHLTPRTLDITAAQLAMERQGLQVKDFIEGPPPRCCPILLRQTSFLAIEETITFCDGSGEFSKAYTYENNRVERKGAHRARFGEIEERGAAVTPTGRRLYDKLLGQVRHAKNSSELPETQNSQNSFATPLYERLLAKEFQKYPDDWKQLRKQGLVYFHYRAVDKRSSNDMFIGLDYLDSSRVSVEMLDKLVDLGLVEATPITYEDFLPLSAVGIFQSNLNTRNFFPSKGCMKESGLVGEPDREGMERALGTVLKDADTIYADIEAESLESCLENLRNMIEVDKCN